METNKTLLILKNKKQTVFTVVLLCFVIAGLLTAVQPFMYKTESKILVYQENTDPYAMTKSGQYLSSLLTSIVSTNSFYEEVVNSGYNINVFYFSSNEADRMEIWKNSVEPSIVDDSGLFRIDVYHTDKYQSKQIAQAINYVLKTKHKEYHGAGENVTIKIVDSPISSNFPVRPRFVLNLFAGVMSGFVLSFFYIYLFPESRFDIRIFPKKKANIKVSAHTFKKTEEKKDENLDSAQKIREGIQRALDAQSILKEKEPIMHNENNNINKNSINKIDNKKSDTKEEIDSKFDENDIEREGSMDNVIGFSNLGT